MGIATTIPFFGKSQFKNKIALNLYCLDRTKFLTAITLYTARTVDLGLSRFDGNGFLRTKAHTFAAAYAFLFIDLRSRLQQAVYPAAEQIRQNLERIAAV